MGVMLVPVLSEAVGRLGTAGENNMRSGQHSLTPIPPLRITEDIDGASKARSPCLDVPQAQKAFPRRNPHLTPFKKDNVDGVNLASRHEGQEG